MTEQPGPEHLAAITAAYLALAQRHAVPAAQPISRWALAARLPRPAQAAVRGISRWSAAARTAS